MQIAIFIVLGVTPDTRTPLNGASSSQRQTAEVLAWSGNKQSLYSSEAHTCRTENNVMFNMHEQRGLLRNRLDP